MIIRVIRNNNPRGYDSKPMNRRYSNTFYSVGFRQPTAIQLAFINAVVEDKRKSP